MGMKPTHYLLQAVAEVIKGFVTVSAQMHSKECQQPTAKGSSKHELSNIQIL